MHDASGTIIKEFLVKSQGNDFESLPLENLASAATLAVIELSHASVYVGGRYIKFQRNVSNTVWVVDGKKVTEGSVDEMIAQTVQPYFKASDYKFVSAGREDCDVRMLGNGRPFILEMLNPHRLIRNQQVCRELEDKINQTWHDVLKVSQLQQVSKYVYLLLHCLTCLSE